MPTKKILLAEDNSAHAALIRRAILRTEPSCHLDVVSNGVEVIDYLFGNGEQDSGNSAGLPDLILLDLRMPEMDGLQVLQVLRRVRFGNQSRTPPVVVLTSSDEDIHIVEAYRLGAHSFVKKPVTFEELAAAIRQILAYWLRLNEPPQYVEQAVSP